MNQAAATATISVVANLGNGGTVGGGGTYPVGTNVQITASASNGWMFIGWSDGSTNNPYTITVPAGGATYTARFGWASQLDYVNVAAETYQDKIGYDSAKKSFTYPTGVFSIHAVLFTGAGLAAANLNQNTPVEISIGRWTYRGTTGTLRDAPKYKAKATSATLPLTYPVSNGKTNSAGTVTLGFGKKSTTLAITCKAGQDAQQNPIQSFVDADTFVGNATIGKSIAVTNTVTATITIGDYSESFTAIVITGTDAAKNSKAKDGTMDRLDTVKIKGASHR